MKKLLLFLILGTTLLFYSSYGSSYKIPFSNTTYENIELTEWQVFIIALIEVECERTPNVTSSKGAIGPFQITQIYVDEINRLYGTDYILEDAWDLDKALTMFEMMNDHYNPTRDINEAIRLHNPGAGKWYAKRIKDRIKLVVFNESVRTAIINLYNKI